MMPSSRARFRKLSVEASSASAARSRCNRARCRARRACRRSAIMRRTSRRSSGESGRAERGSGCRGRSREAACSSRRPSTRRSASRYPARWATRLNDRSAGTSKKPGVSPLTSPSTRIVAGDGLEATSIWTDGSSSKVTASSVAATHRSSRSRWSVAAALMRCSRPRSRNAVTGACPSRRPSISMTAPDGNDPTRSRTCGTRSNLSGGAEGATTTTCWRGRLR